MADKLNQHFIPQYALRHFSSRCRNISLLLLRSLTPVSNASIKGQCARHRFYGDQKVEHTLSQYEETHAAAIRRLLIQAEQQSQIDAEDVCTLRQAILLQRFRTPRHIEMFSAMRDDLMKFVFSEAFCESIDEKRLRAYAKSKAKANKVRFPGGAQAIATNSLNYAIQYSPLLGGMELYILVNKTDSPFLMGDAPAVAYNRFALRFANRGVLGVNSRGLMLFLPVTSAVQMALVDPNVYSLKCETSPFVHITNIRDIRALNCLQLCSATNCIYCHDAGELDEAVRFVASFTHLLCNDCGVSRVSAASKWLIDGKPRPGQALHSFERQVPFSLSLECLRYKEALSESVVIGGRHPKSSNLFRQCDATPGPFPESEFPIDIEIE